MELARKYFNLKNDPRLRIFHEDGRTFINRDHLRYDAIFVDAFNSLSVPYQLTTKEAIARMYSLMEDGGIVITNLISTVSGRGSKFLHAEYRTYKEIFPYVYVLPTRSEAFRLDQNVMIVARKSASAPEMTSINEELNSYLKNLMPNNFSLNVTVLTDDYAPVDQYSAELLMQK